MDDRAAALARLFEAVHEGVYIGTIDARTAHTIASNAHLKLIFGYAPETAESEVRPFASDRFIDPQDRAGFLERLRSSGAVTDYLIRLKRLDGQPVWIEVTANASPTPFDAAPSTSLGALSPSPLDFAQGDPEPVEGSKGQGRPEPDRGARSGGSTLHLEALVRDVSERKKLDDQSRDLYHQLLQAEKMAALGQTISGVAHELNNPLATILSWAERLSERSTDDRARRGLDVILREAERAARIVRNLLTFARKRQSTRMMVDVNQLVRETLALRAYEQRVTNVHVIHALASGLPQVFADGHQVQQVLLNLVINAEQAMLTANGRGTLVMRTWHDVDRKAVVIEVNDDGPGVPEETRGKIFDPFFTTKEVGKGTGLGLTVAYAIVQEHGGRIWLKSPPSRGASFFVELPVAAPELAASKAAPQPVSLDDFQGRHVLVVEDEPALAVAVSEALSDAGFIVSRAGDGEEGLTQLSQASYDLIVCDLKMPRIDGMQFYRAMAAAMPALARRVIFVTGDVAGTDAERFLDETGCRWLSKPFRLGDLLRAARDTLA